MEIVKGMLKTWRETSSGNGRKCMLQVEPMALMVQGPTIFP